MHKFFFRAFNFLQILSCRNVTGNFLGPYHPVYVVRCDVIQVGAGQRINVTMYDYSYSAAALSQLSESDPRQRSVRPTQAPTCRVFATIREPARGATTTTVCDMRGRRVNVFTSDADRIELRIMTVTRPVAAPRASSSSSSSSGGGKQPAAANRHDEDVEHDNYVMFQYTGEASTRSSAL